MVKPRTRRAILSSLTALPALSFFSNAAPASIELRSPNGRIRITLVDDRLAFRVTANSASVIETSPLGILVDGVNLGEGARIVRTEKYGQRGTYESRGVHTRAVNHFNGVRIHFRHPTTVEGFVVDLRAFNDGVAFRTIVPGERKNRVPDEATTFVIPEGSLVWYHYLKGITREFIRGKRSPESGKVSGQCHLLPSSSQGAPVTPRSRKVRS